MGTIIRLLNKQSSVGCIDNVYKSVENLDAKYLNTNACKTMLLEPRSSAEKLCEDLLINVDNRKPRRLYTCPSFDCYTEKSKVFSTIAGVSCSCGRTMNDDWESKKVKSKKEAFLKGEATYMISDDLNVFPATISNVVTFYQMLGIDDVNVLEKRVVDVNRDGLLNLLKIILLSKIPLTDAFHKKPRSHVGQKTKLTNLSQVKLEDTTKDQDKTVILKLMWDKTKKRVLYAEADHVMVDNLFSFLAFPLGSIVKLLNKNSFFGCVDNLYNSIDILAYDSDCSVSETCKRMLLSPCLYWQYDCSYQIVNIEQPNVPSRATSYLGCEICWENFEESCKHDICDVIINEINPKMPNLVTKNGGGYTKKYVKFMISDEMMITPFSLISGTDIVKDLKVSVFDLILQEVAVGEAEVVNLLKACLASASALNSLFSMVKSK